MVSALKLAGYKVSPKERHVIHTKQVFKEISSTPLTMKPLNINNTNSQTLSVYYTWRTSRKIKETW